MPESASGIRKNLNGIGKRMQLRGLYFDEEPVWIKDIHGLSNSFEYVKMLSDKINQLTPKDAGILFSGFDDRFSLEDNRISMAMKQIQKISLKIVEHNIDRLIEEYHCDPHQMYLAVAGGIC